MATARPNHWGVRVGKVLTVRNGRAKVQLQRELHNGDGLEARGVYGDRGVVVQGIQGDLLRVPEGVRPGDELFRTTDVQQLERARESYAKEHRRTRADAHFEAHIGRPCRLTLGGAEALGDVVQPARGKPLEESAVRAQIAKLGDTVLELGNLTCAIDENAFLSVSALNALRREAAQQCERMLLEKRSPDRTVRPYEAPSFASYAAQGPLLILQSDDVRELLAAQGEADELYYAPSDLTAPELQKALDQLPQKVRVVLPNILSDKELSEAMRVIGPRSIVCGNPAQLQSGCVTDVGLNVFNAAHGEKAAGFGCDSRHGFAGADLCTGTGVGAPRAGGAGDSRQCAADDAAALSHPHCARSGRRHPCGLQPLRAQGRSAHRPQGRGAAAEAIPSGERLPGADIWAADLFGADAGQPPCPERFCRPARYRNPAGSCPGATRAER